MVNSIKMCRNEHPERKERRTGENYPNDAAAAASSPASRRSLSVGQTKSLQLNPAESVVQTQKHEDKKDYWPGTDATLSSMASLS